MRLNVRLHIGSPRMSHIPPPNPPPPYYCSPPHWPPPPPHHGGHPPHHGGHPPHPPPHTYPPHGPPYPYYPYYPATMMVPVPTAVPAPEAQPTYITNYIYHGESSNQTAPVVDQVQIAETAGDYEWIPTTATTANQLSGRAVIGGHEGWDGSPLWVIRTWYNGDLIPGKLSVRHNAASIMYDGKEVPVQNIDVLCAKPDNLRWVPASNGSVPPGAIAGGRTSSGEQLYVGRARHQLSITPGKVQPSHNCCYIAFAGAEVSHKVYDVLCRIS